MFGVLPLLRGLLFGVVVLAAVALALLVVGTLARLALKRAGIDTAELRAYRERRRIYLDQLRQLEAQLLPLDVTSPEFEQASHTLQAYQEAEPLPPTWAFWLRPRR